MRLIADASIPWYILLSTVPLMQSVRCTRVVGNCCISCLWTDVHLVGLGAGGVGIHTDTIGSV